MENEADSLQVLQWFWFGTGAAQTYESCVDMVVADTAASSVVSPAKAVAASPVVSPAIIASTPAKVTAAKPVAVADSVAATEPVAVLPLPVPSVAASPAKLKKPASRIRGRK